MPTLLFGTPLKIFHLIIISYFLLIRIEQTPNSLHEELSDKNHQKDLPYPKKKNKSCYQVGNTDTAIPLITYSLCKHRKGHAAKAGTSASSECLLVKFSITLTVLSNCSPLTFYAGSQIQCYSYLCFTFLLSLLTQKAAERQSTEKYIGSTFYLPFLFLLLYLFPSLWLSQKIHKRNM